MTAVAGTVVRQDWEGEAGAWSFDLACMCLSQSSDEGQGLTITLGQFSGSSSSSIRPCVCGCCGLVDPSGTVLRFGSRREAHIFAICESAQGCFKASCISGCLGGCSLCLEMRLGGMVLGALAFRHVICRTCVGLKHTWVWLRVSSSFHVAVCSQSAARSLAETMAENARCKINDVAEGHSFDLELLMRSHHTLISPSTHR